MDNLQGSTPNQNAENPQNNIQSTQQVAAQSVQTSVLSQSSLLVPNATINIDNCTQNCSLGVATPASSTAVAPANFWGFGLLAVAAVVVGIFAIKVLKS